MTFEKYIEKDGKRYRMGYTTGSAAAAAARAAVQMLYNRQVIKKTKIITPADIELELEVIDQKLENNWGQAAVTKDAGDDPDVTDGLKVYAVVEKIDENNILIKGGNGVGKITKPGLSLPVGEAAINPVPRKMIKKAVREFLPEGEGVRVTIKIPEGKKVAEKTFNPKLGIKGGISVLGTTGIVEPMSESAYKESLAVELKQAVAMGEKELIFVFGNYGKKLAAELGYKKEAVIRMSNFVGYMLDQTKELEIDSILMIGHIGKIVKVAGGIYNTHSKKADGRKEIIAAYTALFGAGQDVIRKIFAANTAEEAANILLKYDLKPVFDLLAERVTNKVKDRLENKLKVSSIIFSLKEGILGSYGLKEGMNYE